MSKSICAIGVAIGSDGETATVRFSGRSHPVVCQLLGSEVDLSGKPVKLYLNSLIHAEGKNTQYVGWVPSGCISTILTKVEPNELSKTI